MFEIKPNSEYIQCMRYIDVKEASTRWGITDRRIRLLCTQGRIDGAIKLGWSWMIPADTPKPRDGRHLRRYRTLDIRPGTVDVDKMRTLAEEVPLTADLIASGSFAGILRMTLEALLSADGISMDDRDARSILSGRVVPSVPLDLHLVIVNFRSILISLAANGEKWSEKSARDAHARLMQGIDDLTGADYRPGYALYPPREGENPTIPVQMETTFGQYEASWRNMHGLVSAVLLYAGILRIRPYEEYGAMYSYLILAGELMRNGILPPLLDKASEDEAKAAFSLALSSGNYGDFTHFIERKVHEAYHILRKK